MKIALIECPHHPLDIDWKDVYFPETPFPISDYLYDERHELKVWDFQEDANLAPQDLIQDLQQYQPVVLGINDHHSTNGLVLERLIKQLFPRSLVFFSPEQMSAEDLLDRSNLSAYRLRQRTRVASGKLRFRSSWEDKELFADLPEKTREQAWQQVELFESRYALSQWRNYLSLEAYRLTLEVLEVLQDCFDASQAFWQKDQLRILDVGSARWPYAPALYQFFSQAYTQSPRQIYMTGIEVDPYRVDTEGYSYVDYALSYIDPIASFARYLNQDILHYTPQEPYDVVTAFNPYVEQDEHLMGGLPLEYFQPEALGKHIAQDLLSDAGAVLMTQTQEPHFFKQREILKQLDLESVLNGRFESALGARYVEYVSLFAQKHPK